MSSSSETKDLGSTGVAMTRQPSDKEKDDIRRFVVNRYGHTEPINENAIRVRLELLAGHKTRDDLVPKKPLKNVDIFEIVSATTKSMTNMMKTSEIDVISADECHNLVSVHPEYAILGGRILCSMIEKRTPVLFSETTKQLQAATLEGESASLVADDYAAFVETHKVALDAMIDRSRSDNFTYQGMRALMASYLLKPRDSDRFIEDPQSMYLRIAVQKWMGDELITEDEKLAHIKIDYDLISDGWYSPATPTFFNSGTPRPAVASCFLATVKDDSIEGIYDTKKIGALVSRGSGGFGFSCTNVRCAGSYIKGTNGTSNGIVPMLRTFNADARYVDQGGGKRKGASASYLEPWHADFNAWLELRNVAGSEEERCRDLFQGVWLNELLVKRADAGKLWSFFDPKKCPDLVDSYDDDFKKRYEAYEAKKMYVRQEPARDVLERICKTVGENSMPYIMNKDACNRLSNQQNIGVIRNSNLCTEITEFSSSDTVAVCNLSSVCLPKFVNEKREFDFARLDYVVRRMVLAVDRLMDIVLLPCAEAVKGNQTQRAMALGWMGLSDCFNKMRIPWESKEAALLNKRIAEVMYHAFVTETIELAKKYCPYEYCFKGPKGPSPFSQGRFQMHLHKPDWEAKKDSACLDLKWVDWDARIQDAKKYGARHSLGIGLMPGATTSVILNHSEGIDPRAEHMLVRRTLNSEFVQLNHYLVEELQARGLWTKKIRTLLKNNQGSVQNIPGIPDDVKEVFKTAYEMSQKAIMTLAADRGLFVDQSQSMNLHMKAPKVIDLINAIRFGVDAQLKTILYYCRRYAAQNPEKFAIVADTKPSVGDSNTKPSVGDSNTKPEANVCRRDDPTCESCGV